MKLTVLALVVMAAWGCSDSKGSGGGSDGGATADGGADGGDPFSGTPSEELRVPVQGRVYVKLSSPPAIVKVADPKTDKSWDLAFEGLDVFTNSGPSGSGLGSGFGPLETLAFLGGTAPAVPFLAPDTTGGAFIRWWFYGGGAADHQLFSRFHDYGVKDGAKLYKVQVLNYYGLRAGAPVPALYHVRWTEVLPAGFGPAKELADLDGTAGYIGTTPGPANAKIECLDLGTSARVMLSPAEARASSAWHLCFRRQDISVNGEVGGPRGVTAVDLDAANTPNEKLADVIQKTPDTEKARYDAVNAMSLAGQTFRGDRVVSAFGTLWLEAGANPVAPAKVAWFVIGADGNKKFVLGFASFEGATATSPGIIVMRVKTVQ